MCLGPQWGPRECKGAWQPQRGLQTTKGPVGHKVVPLTGKPRDYKGGLRTTMGPNEYNRAWEP